MINKVEEIFHEVADLAEERVCGISTCTRRCLDSREVEALLIFDFTFWLPRWNMTFTTLYSGVGSF